VPRGAAEVAAAAAAAQAAAAAAAERAAFRAAARAARGAPAGAKPAPAEWLAGPHAARVRALEDLALEREGGGGAHALAMDTLQVRRGSAALTLP